MFVTIFCLHLRRHGVNLKHVGTHTFLGTRTKRHAPREHGAPLRSRERANMSKLQASRRHRILVAAAAAAASSAGLVSSASAATLTWNGGGADANLNTALNWIGGVAPVAGDTLI